MNKLMQIVVLVHVLFPIAAFCGDWEPMDNPLSNTDGSLTGIWGNSTDDVYAVGEHQALGSSFTSMEEVGVYSARQVKILQGCGEAPGTTSTLAVQTSLERQEVLVVGILGLKSICPLIVL